MGAVSEKDNDDDDEENSATRFTARLLNWLIQGFQAKDKIVRFRCVQLIGELIAHLGEIEYVPFSILVCSLTSPTSSAKTHTPTSVLLSSTD